MSGQDYHLMDTLLLVIAVSAVVVHFMANTASLILELLLHPEAAERTLLSRRSASLKTENLYIYRSTKITSFYSFERVFVGCVSTRGRLEGSHARARVDE